jgi:hypothetical protein
MFYCGDHEDALSFDVTSCSLVEVYRRVGGIYCLQLQRRREANQVTSFDFEGGAGTFL